MSEEKKCPECGKTLRSDNTRGICSKCAAGGQKSKGRSSEVGKLKKRFKVIADALGYDAEDLLCHYMERWLKRVSDQVRPPSADEDL